MATSCGCGCGHKGAVRESATRYTGDTIVREVAADPAGLAVLERFGLNHCCGAHLSLREGAAAAGVDLDFLLAALSSPASVTA
jgi:iron-sulfur cluster repair protein YtfE (RIC family)